LEFRNEGGAVVLVGSRAWENFSLSPWPDFTYFCG